MKVSWRYLLRVLQIDDQQGGIANRRGPASGLRRGKAGVVGDQAPLSEIQRDQLPQLGVVTDDQHRRLTLLVPHDFYLDWDADGTQRIL